MSEPTSDWDPLPPEPMGDLGKPGAGPAASGAGNAASATPAAGPADRFVRHKPGGVVTAGQASGRDRNRQKLHDELAQLMGQPLARPATGKRPKSPPPPPRRPKAEADVLTAAVQAVVTPVPVPASAPGQDPRQAEPWFQALPLAEQARLVKLWRTEAARSTGLQPGSKLERLGRAYAAKCVFSAAAVLLLLAFGFSPLPRIALGAVAVMLLWQVVPQRPAWLALAAVPVFAACTWPELWNGDTPQLLLAWLGVGVTGFLSLRTDLALRLYRKVLRR